MENTGYPKGRFPQNNKLQVKVYSKEIWKSFQGLQVIEWTHDTAIGLWVHDVTLTLSRGKWFYALCTSSEFVTFVTSHLKIILTVRERTKILLCEFWVHNLTLTLSQGQWFMCTPHRPNMLNICDKLFEKSHQTLKCNSVDTKLWRTDGRTDNKYPCHKQYAPTQHERKQNTLITLTFLWRLFRQYQNSLLCNSYTYTILFSTVLQPSLSPSVLTTCLRKGACDSIEPCIPRHQYWVTLYIINILQTICFVMGQTYKSNISPH